MHEKQTLLQIKPEVHRHNSRCSYMYPGSHEVRHQGTHLGSTVLSGPNFGFGVNYKRPAQHLSGAWDGWQGLSGELSFWTYTLLLKVDQQVPERVKHFLGTLS